MASAELLKWLSNLCMTFKDMGTHICMCMCNVHVCRCLEKERLEFGPFLDTGELLVDRNVAVRGCIPQYQKM